MRYHSTRDKSLTYSFKESVITGLASDGGLLLPEYYPKIDYTKLRNKSYQDIAFEVIKTFVDDIPEEDLRNLIYKSYSDFDNPKVVPLVKLNDCYLAELFHGPTYAFKDIALQFLGNLFEYVLSESKNHINIIGATSGDTGSAAIYGVKGKKNINICILYPNNRISPMQEAQMTTIPDANVHTLAVDGTFDDCQAMIKKFFSDLEFKNTYHLAAVNSINWARVMAQIVYYFYIYSELNTDKKVNFIVPTGNFGNIFAGYAAMNMGLPIKNLVIATNENNILHRMVQDGDYSLREVKQTYSPSMDIQIASNFERFLFYLYDNDTDKLKSSINALRLNGKIVFSDKDKKVIQSSFLSYGVSNKETLSTIQNVYKSAFYITDPHTACGVCAAQKLALDPEETVVLATAHPAKFGDAVKEAIGINPVTPKRLSSLLYHTRKKEIVRNNTPTVEFKIKEFFNHS